jgi:nucleotide-binding universal stress UspA family protein
MYRNLLIPLDGSTFGEHALPFACSIAQRHEAVMHLAHVHVLNDPIYIEGMPVIDANLHSLAREHERVYLERLRDDLRSTRELWITCANLDSDGSIAGTLAHYAEASKIDLVVMTTHGRGGLARAWLGSVADALVRCSQAPILLLRPGEEAPDLAQPPQLKRILIPLDGSELSEQIVEPALELGGPTQVEYTLLRVVEPFIIAVGYPPPVQTSRLDVKLSQEQLAEGQAYVDRVADRLRAAGYRTQARALLAERVAAAILDEARRQNADLIAMTTHGRSGLARVLLGSVADKVLRGGAVPMLLARPRESDSEARGYSEVQKD